MNPALVPIPPGNLEETKYIWWPYVASISERDKCDPDVKVEMLQRGEVQACIIWDADTKKPMAFLGVQFVLRGKDRMAQLVWLAGENRAAWVHLFRDLEIYLRDKQGCKALRAIARPGWEKHLKANGFRETHRVFDKELAK